VNCSILWLRRDLRLDDNPALQAAMRDGAVVPVYVHAPDEEAPWSPGAASGVWLQRSLTALQADLDARGTPLLLRSGPTLPALLALIEETGAQGVHWNRLYDPAVIARDATIKRALTERGIAAHSHNAALLVEPWTIATGGGAPYRVFTPFWRNARTRLDQLPTPDAAPSRIASIDGVLPSLRVDDILPSPTPRWDRGFWEHWTPGEAGAIELLDAFIEGAARGYREQRDLPDRIGTSRLSPHLHFGEISPRRIVARLQAERWPAAVAADVEGYIRELGWREFSHHLLYHFPSSAQSNLNPKFDDFSWAARDETLLDAWRLGRTGIPIVDAGMRELWHTGWMHNRVRMVVASFLTKNMRQHWLEGARWFWDTLVDADLPNNTQGWQWSAGTGADAAPYFRIFNPVSQAQRFDPLGRYVRRWIPELAALPDKAIFAPWEHADLLRASKIDYPTSPIVDLKGSREAALEAYRRSRNG
jgi:deoxyribodipyrimidine photo-lyase